MLKATHLKFLVLLLGWIPAAALAQDPSGSGLSREEQVDVIKNPQAAKIPLLLEDFVQGSGAAAEDTRRVFQVVSDDLKFSGQFSIIQIPQIQPEDTLPAGNSLALARGTVEIVGGELVLRGSLESLPGRDLIFGKDYRTRPEWYREAAHRFADDIVYALTGERGIARTKIAFISNRSGNKEIYVVDYDGAGLRQVTRNGSINMSPAWSPDGGRLAFVSYKGGDPDIYTVDLATGKVSLVVGGPGVQGAPAYSPDGGRIAYSQTSGTESEIYVCNEDGSGKRRITRVGGINTSPCWSPDGRRIVFTSDRSGNPQLYMADTDGGGIRRLTYEGKWNDIPSWSADGRRIVYSSRRDGGGFRIVVIDPSGYGDESLRTFGPGSDEHPSWAPDGRHVVFTSTRSSGGGLYVLDVDAGSFRPLTQDMSGCSAADWSPVPGR